MKNGEIYFTIASWTGAGQRVEQCVWRGDMVDHNRASKGLVFETHSDAQAALSKSK
jgi:hypothetical protein